MKLKLIALLVIIVTIILFIIGIMDNNPFFIAVVLIFILSNVYLIWWSQFYKKYKKLNDILDEKCDPVNYIEEYEKAKSISKKAAFQNLCSLNIAIGLDALGRTSEALDAVHKGVDLQAKSSESFKAVYHQALFCFYINSNDLENAAFELDNYLKGFRKKFINPIFSFATDMSVAEYQYIRYKSTETAKVFLEQLDYLSNTYSKNLSRRFRLNVLYNKAVIFEELGDYESAAENYKAVAENGGGLWIAEASRKKLEKIKTPDTQENEPDAKY